MNHFSDFIVSRIQTTFMYNWTLPDPDESSFSDVLQKAYLLNTTVQGFPKDATWEEFTAFKQSNLTKRAISKMKYMRNQLLQQSDWVLTYDNVQSVANLDDWINYRKLLRDFFTTPSFQVILVPGTEEPDLMAMNFPPPQPPITRK